MARVHGRSSQLTSAPNARLVVDAIPGLAWSSRPDGSIEFFNGRWYDYTGLSPEESFGWGWKVAVHGDDVAQLLNRWAPRDAEGGRECEVRLRRSDGDFQWFLLRHEPFCDLGGAVVRCYGTWINIEDSKQKELLGAARKLVLDHGLRAAWSEPLISNSGEVLGTFCIGYSQPRIPTNRDLQLIEAAGHIARIAIERHQSQEALTTALEQSRIPRPIFVG